jgi:hypothetical protein
LLVIAIVTMIAAIAAAYFGYPGWKASRAKPDLRLMVEAGPATSARFHIKLQNDGNGSATDWKLTITMPRGSRFSPVGWNFPGWSDREARNGWIATWMAQGSDDSIGPGLHRDILMEPAAANRKLFVRPTPSRRTGWQSERVASKSRSARGPIGLRRPGSRREPLNPAPPLRLGCLIELMFGTVAPRGFVSDCQIKRRHQSAAGSGGPALEEMRKPRVSAPVGGADRYTHGFRAFVTSRAGSLGLGRAGPRLQAACGPARTVRFPPPCPELQLVRVSAELFRGCSPSVLNKLFCPI